MVSYMDILSKIWNSLVVGVTTIFPTSPFTDFIGSFAQLPFLGYLNWFFPVGPCLVILAAWLVAYGLYLGFSIIARWLKVIGD